MPKDPTAAERARRYRERRKLALAGRDDAHVLPFDPVREFPARVDAPKRKVDERPYEVRFRSWAEARLVVPVGLRRGRPFRLQDWQCDFVANAMRPGVREAGLSVARKNGKSALVAALLLFELVEIRAAGWRAVVASLTGELAKELRHQIEAMRDAAGITGIEVMRSPQPGRIQSSAGGQVTFLAADRASGHAVGADLAIVDEAGLLGESKRDLWDALRSCISGRDGRFLAISIRGDGPMFAELGERAKDAAVHWREYAPSEDAPIDEPETWAAGNPGLGEIKSLEYMRDRARMAVATPADSNNFRALDLNMPVSPTRASIVQVDDWKRCCVESESELPERTGPCYIGVDLGGATSLSAVAAYWPEGGRLDVWVAAPAVPDPIERGKRDGVGMVYARAVEAGFLLLTPGRTTSVPQLLGEALGGLAGASVRALGADRFRQPELLQALNESGTRESDFGHPRLVWRGTGAGRTAHGSADVRSFQRAVLEGRLRTRNNPLSTMAIAESEIRVDSAGNPALDKARARARIDILQASVIAVGLSDIDPNRELLRQQAAGNQASMLAG